MGRSGGGPGQAGPAARPNQDVTSGKYESGALKTERKIRADER
jgi:hypothetical protein